MTKNNITRLLNQRKIPYTAFELPEEKLGAQETARQLGVAAAQVFKTIVVKREGRGKTILAIVPGDTEVDLKALARALGEKKLQLTTQREAETLTNLQAGGISPLALLNKGFECVLDQSAQTWEQIHISGGQRGLNLRLPTPAFIQLIAARLAPISKPSTPQSE